MNKEQAETLLVLVESRLFCIFMASSTHTSWPSPIYSTRLRFDDYAVDYRIAISSHRLFTVHDSPIE